VCVCGWVCVCVCMVWGVCVCVCVDNLCAHSAFTSNYDF